MSKITCMSQSLAKENIYRLTGFHVNLCLKTLKSKMCFSGVFLRNLNIYYTIPVEDKVLCLYKEVRFYLYKYLLFFRFLDLKNKERIYVNIKL